MSDSLSENRAIFTASVSGNKAIGDNFFRLRLELDSSATKAFKKVQPGQFAELDLSVLALPRPEQIPAELSDRASRGIILRRPFSFAEVKYAGSKVTI
jgi:NAD(P)H-flavin reductase